MVYACASDVSSCEDLIIRHSASILCRRSEVGTAWDWSDLGRIGAADVWPESVLRPERSRIIPSFFSSSASSPAPVFFVLVVLLPTTSSRCASTSSTYLTSSTPYSSPYRYRARHIRARRAPAPRKGSESTIPAEIGVRGRWRGEFRCCRPRGTSTPPRWHRRQGRCRGESGGPQGAWRGWPRTGPGGRSTSEAPSSSRKGCRCRQGFPPKYWMRTYSIFKDRLLQYIAGN